MSLYDDSNPHHLEYLEFHRASRAAREARMIDPKAIRDAAEAFIIADAAYTAHGITTEERKIDLAIAERGGDADAIAAARDAKQATANEWHGHYMARQDTADALVRATGVDPRKLASAIKRY